MTDVFHALQTSDRQRHSSGEWSAAVIASARSHVPSNIFFTLSRSLTFQSVWAYLFSSSILHLCQFSQNKKNKTKTKPTGISSMWAEGSITPFSHFKIVKEDLEQADAAFQSPGTPRWQRPGRRSHKFNMNTSVIRRTSNESHFCVCFPKANTTFNLFSSELQALHATPI